MTGRGLLALASRAFGTRLLTKERPASIRSLTTVLRRRKAVSVSLLLLFVLGPVPSNELFTAVGLAKVPLLPLLAIFGLARFVSYVLWVAVAVQIAGLMLVLVLVRVDWSRLLRHWLPAERRP